MPTWAIKMLQIAVSIGGAVVVETWLKNSELHVPLLYACGALAGITQLGAGQMNVRDAEEVAKKVVSSVYPPSSDRE